MNTSSPSPTIELETVTDSLLSELRRLYPDQAHKEAIWRWQFAPRLGRDCLVLTARENQRLVGFNALMPVSISYEGSEHDAWWSCDFIVDPEFQGRGIGSRLKDAMLEKIEAPILSMGISSQAWPILIKKGWEPGPSLFLYERIFKPSRERQRLLQLWSSLRSGVSRIAEVLQSSSKWQLESLNELPAPDLIDKLRYGGRNHNSVEAIKDHAYLSWRYASFPFKCYQYLLFRDGAGVPKGLLIYRVDRDSRVEVTDCLGCTPNATLVRAIASKLKTEGARSIFWRIQAQDLSLHLVRAGFIRKRYATRFVYRAGQRTLHSWRLSSGDSDGDFLGAALDSIDQAPKVSVSPRRYSVEQVSPKDVQASRKAWDALVHESGANPLFMSWLWQTNWWKQWGEPLGLELRCFNIYCDNRLVGIVPLFKVKRGSVWPTEYHFLGNAWRLFPSIRSEYIEPILAREHQPELYEYLQRWLGRLSSWSFVIVPDHNGSMTKFPKTLIRQRDRGYRISTSGSMGEYLKCLGKNTRLRAFNRHDYLIATYPSARWGSFKLEDSDLEYFFDQLNRFHEARWGAPCFSDKAIAFHRDIIDGRSEELRPLLHYLEVDGEIRSVSYNLWAGGIMYNIQSGFDADFDNKLSLGTLHFGKLISLCFDDKDIQALDLLAGRGKRTDYKNHFQGDVVSFNTLQVFPSRALFCFYWLIAQGKSCLERIRMRSA